jgi:precorrin-6Y C5,15-methyltransferase (decarboxylating)
MSGHSIVVIGIGADGLTGLSAEAKRHIAEACVLAGGRRHLESFGDWPGEKLALGSDVASFVAAVRDRYRQQRTVVLASGDPLFYGIGRALLEAIPRDDLVFLPHVSSVQLAFARIKETWHDAQVVSLHGRPPDALIAAVRAREPKIAILTDARNHPAAIAEILRGLGAALEYTLWVCEDLGGRDERISRHRPADLRDVEFSPLNVVILMREAKGEAGEIPVLGIPEAALLGDGATRGMVTRREVRLLALCRLELRPGDVLWDIGAGSGSVAIEAARLSPRLQAFAIERDAAARQQLERNVARFSAAAVRIIAAEAPEGLDGLPDPEAVFIGGSGGRLAEILVTVARRLKCGGRVVLNCVTLESFARGWECLADLNLGPEATSVQLAHSRPLGRWHSMHPENPIFILRGRKP